MAGRHVLLVEDDRWIADVLVQIVEAASPGARTDWYEDVLSAQGAFDAGAFDLVICDWNLPGQPGIDLVAHVRRQLPKLPIIMITGRSDRASVMAARASGADAFIVKPFQVERVLATLQRLLGHAASGAAGEGAPVDLATYLAELPDAALELASLQGLRQGMDLLHDSEPPDLRVLAQEWEHEPVLCARLIAMANSTAYNRNATVCGNLAEALVRLGWRTSVNVATALAMRRSAQLRDSRLASRAQRQLELSEELSDRVYELAHHLRIDPAACHTAALLHRLGELCVLLHLQAYQDRCGAVADEAELVTALERFARPFADRLKTYWHLPVAVRELIGAVYALPPGTTRPEKYLMRVAGNCVYHDLEPAEDARLRRLAGLL